MNILTEAWQDVWPDLYAYVIQPGISILAAYVVAKIKTSVDSVSASVRDTQDKAALSAATQIQKNSTDELDVTVKAAVAASMKIANELKARNNGVLNESQIAELKRATQEIVRNSLPDSLTEDGGAIKEIMGGEVAIYQLIDTMIEKHVLEYKCKMGITDSFPSG